MYPVLQQLILKYKLCTDNNLSMQAYIFFLIFDCSLYNFTRFGIELLNDI